MKKLLFCLFLTLLLSAFLTSTSLAGDFLASAKNNEWKSMAEDAKSLIQIIEESKKASIREAKRKIREAKKEGNKLADDYEVMKAGFHKKFFPNGTASAKYIRLPSPGHPFKMYLSKGNKHFKLQTRSGHDISLEQMRREAKKKGRFFINEDFKVVPTAKKDLTLMFEVL